MVLLAAVPARAQSLALARVLPNLSPSPTPAAHFGFSVALSASTVNAGAPSETAFGPGVAFVFDGVNSILLDQQPMDGDEFGFSIAAAGDNVVVGVPGANLNGLDNAGVVYFFGRDGSLRTTMQKVMAAIGDRFGFAVAASSTRVLVGAPGDNTGGKDAGAAYVFDGDPSSPTFGQQLATILKPSAAPADEFGASVTIGGDRIVVGAPFDSDVVGNGGAAYVFDLQGNFVPPKLQKTSPAPGDLFGASVTTEDGRTIVVGAPLDDSSATDAGAVYLFDDRLSEAHQFVSSTPAPGDQFGFSVAMVGTQLAVGVPEGNVDSVQAGTVLLFDGDVTNSDFGKGLQMIPSPNPQPDGRFGFALSTADGTLAIGAPREGDAGVGKVYLFAAGCGTPLLNCDDDDPCTADFCDPTLGCQHMSIPGTAITDQGTVCGATTTTTTTFAGSTTTITFISTTTSTSTTLPACSVDSDCDDHNPCTTDRCRHCDGCFFHPWPCCADPTLPRCVHPNVLDGTSCDDGDACTLTDTCQGGTCVGMNVVCIASDKCHDAGTCDPVTGLCSNPKKPNGTTCDDGNACTVGDTCQTGKCIGEFIPRCQPCKSVSECTAGKGPCRTLTCDGHCLNPTVPDGTLCDDQDACTLTDTCRGGTCLGMDPVVCTASDQCHDPGICDSTTGLCSNPTKHSDKYAEVGCALGEQLAGVTCTIPLRIKRKADKGINLLESTDSPPQIRRQRMKLDGALSLFSAARRITNGFERKHRLGPQCAGMLRGIFDQGKVDVRGLIAGLHN